MLLASMTMMVTMSIQRDPMKSRKYRWFLSQLMSASLPVADAVVDIWAVVIEPLYTHVADVAVPAASSPDYLAIRA